MLVKLTEIYLNGTYSTSQQYIIRDVFINPEHVIMIREETRMKHLNECGNLNDGLERENSFTKLTINRGNSGTEIVVLGAPEIIETTLNQKTGLLKG
jgi:hypothetical protein